jgi:hypothetical protein
MACMKANLSTIAALPFLFAAFAFTGCSTVNIKQPAGDKAMTLEPEIWEGTWRGADGVRCVSKILDPAKGLIEIGSSSPGEKEETFYLAVHELNDRLVATAVPKPGEKIRNEGVGFFRIAIADEHVALFLPVERIFKGAVAKGTIAGMILKAKNQNDRDVIILDKFGAAELDKLPLEKKGSVLECFDPDPALVFVKEKKAAATEKKK